MGEGGKSFALSGIQIAEGTDCLLAVSLPGLPSPFTEEMAWQG